MIEDHPGNVSFISARFLPSSSTRPRQSDRFYLRDLLLFVFSYAFIARKTEKRVLSRKRACILCRQIANTVRQFIGFDNSLVAGGTHGALDWCLRTYSPSFISHSARIFDHRANRVPTESIHVFSSLSPTQMLIHGIAPIRQQDSVV